MVAERLMAFSACIIDVPGSAANISNSVKNPGLQCQGNLIDDTHRFCQHMKGSQILMGARLLKAV